MCDCKLAKHSLYSCSSQQDSSGVCLLVYAIIRNNEEFAFIK